MVIILLSVLGGFLRGLIVQLASIGGVFIALAVAKAEYMDARRFLDGFVHATQVLTPIAFIGVFIIIWWAVQVLARRLRALLRILFLGLVDRLLGAALGLVQGILLVQIGLFLARMTHDKALHEALAHSRLASTFLNVIPHVNQFVPHLHS